MVTENKHLRRDNRALKKECAAARQTYFKDATAMADLDGDAYTANESHEEDFRTAEPFSDDVITVALTAERSATDALISSIRQRHEQEVDMLESQYREMKAKYERRLSQMEARVKTLATSLPPYPQTPAADPVASLVPFGGFVSDSPRSPTYAPPVPLPPTSTELPDDVHQCIAMLSARLEVVERELASTRQEKDYTQEKLNAVLAACKLDTVDGLYQFWNTIGGTNGWRSTLSEEALTSILNRSTVKSAWLAPEGATGWCDRATGFVNGREMRDFISVVLARLPGLVALGVHAAPEWVFDWAKIGSCPDPFPALRQLFLSQVRWTEEAIFTTCRKMEELKGGDYLDDIVLDQTAAPAEVNYNHLRRNCHAIVSYFLKPITYPIKESLPKLVWCKVEEDAAHPSPITPRETRPVVEERRADEERCAA